MNWQWPAEIPNLQQQEKPFWYHETSNIVLDFHGDPVTAELVVYSDGNHFMALKDSIGLFLSQQSTLTDVFYLTLPPSLLRGFLQQDAVTIGNLHVSVRPHIFISPVAVITELNQQGVVSQFQPFFRNQGSVLLVRKDNPKRITEVEDLLRADVRVFISNPKSETVSYSGYRDTLLGLLDGQPDKGALLAAELNKPSARIVFGSRIHHREAPMALAQDKCDVAVLYFHLARHYCRAFPALFELIPLEGTPGYPMSSPANLTTENAIGMVAEGGVWGGRFMEFMLGKSVAEIYNSHGLLTSI